MFLNKKKIIVRVVGCNHSISMVSSFITNRCNRRGHSTIRQAHIKNWMLHYNAALVKAPGYCSVYCVGSFLVLTDATNDTKVRKEQMKND